MISKEQDRIWAEMLKSMILYGTCVVKFSKDKPTVKVLKGSHLFKVLDKYKWKKKKN